MKIYTVHLTEDYPFLKNGGADPTLQVYLQVQGLDVRRPAMVVLPGGGYTHLCLREGEPIALEFMADGANGFVLNYSVKPCAYPQQLLEVAAAFDYIKTHAEELCVNPQKIAVLGFSAGGHLAASYCTMLHREEIAKHLNPTPAAASVLCYPVISGVCKPHRGSIAVLAGKEDFTEAEASWLSCEKYVTSDTPPAYIWTTGDDNAVPPINSLKYAEALIDHGVPVELHLFPSGPHGQASSKFGTFDGAGSPQSKYNEQWVGEARVWLRRQFHY